MLSLIPLYIYIGVIPTRVINNIIIKFNLINYIILITIDNIALNSIIILEINTYLDKVFSSS